LYFLGTLFGGQQTNRNRGQPIRPVVQPVVAAPMGQQAVPAVQQLVRRPSRAAPPRPVAQPPPDLVTSRSGAAAAIGASRPVREPIQDTVQRSTPAQPQAAAFQTGEERDADG